jgi:CheY-like chemotaxis protein
LSIAPEDDVLTGPDVTDMRSPSPGPVLRLLLVEDNPINQVLAKALLEQTGHTVVTAADGREGLAQWQRGGIDAILMDVQMPVLDGLSATRALREIERQQGRERTPIIAMTANAMSGDREQCLVAGMDDYIAKPFSRIELWAALARALPDPWRVEALVLLAFSAYARGDGPLAGLSLEAALRSDPNHRMAGMLDTALQSGMRPEQIRELARTGYRLAKRLGVQLPPRRDYGRRAV